LFPHFFWHSTTSRSSWMVQVDLHAPGARRMSQRSRHCWGVRPETACPTRRQSPGRCSATHFATRWSSSTVHRRGWCACRRAPARAAAGPELQSAGCTGEEGQPRAVFRRVDAAGAAGRGRGRGAPSVPSGLSRPLAKSPAVEGRPEVFARGRARGGGFCFRGKGEKGARGVWIKWGCGYSSGTKMSWKAEWEREGRRSA
jgi:hypothetical protein